MKKSAMDEKYLAPIDKFLKWMAEAETDEEIKKVGVAIDMAETKAEITSLDASRLRIACAFRSSAIHWFSEAVSIGEDTIAKLKALCSKTTP